MSEEKQAAGEPQAAEDTDEMRPAGEDARLAEARQARKRIDEEEDGDAEAAPDSPLAEEPGDEDTGEQS